MITRRKLIAGASSVGAVTLVAGCSGDTQTQENNNDQTETEDQESNETNENTDQESIETDQIGSEIFVQDMSFSYVFSGGLSSVVEVINNREQGSGGVEVNISMEAYNDETKLGEDNSWQRVEATAGESEYDENIGEDDDYYNRYAEEFELNIEEISQTADNSIDDVTEITIYGRTRDAESVRVATISGSDLRDRVNN